jgi:hypothetical protein
LYLSELPKAPTYVTNSQWLSEPQNNKTTFGLQDMNPTLINQILVCVSKS